VEKAVNSVIEALESSQETIYLLGSVIHNDQMIEHLKAKGARCIDSVEEAVGPASIVIRAHGDTPEVYDAINAKYLTCIDATCPYVKRIHNLVKTKANEGYRIFIAGDANHPEVIGINGWASNNADIFMTAYDTQTMTGGDEKCCIVAQTTITRENWDEIVKVLESKFSNLEKFDTICNATAQRLNEASCIAQESDMVIVVGGRDSSNTQKLYEACSSHCDRTYLIETAAELDRIKPIKHIKIGITAGASTPKWLIEEVIEKVKFLNTDENEIDFKEAFESSLTQLHPGDVVKGKIISFNGNEFFVDVGYKCDGIIPLNEYTDDPFFKSEDAPGEGEEIEVYVVKVNDGEGNVLLSKKKVEAVNSINELEDAFEDKRTIPVRAHEVTNGGLLAYYKGARVFIPASQLGLKYIRDLSDFIGNELNVRIIEFNMQKRRIIGSQRILLEENRDKSATNLWSTIEPGMKITGTVKSFADFGAFIDLGGVDGLIHLSELSWSKIKHPSELLKIGDKVEVSILDFDREKKRISLKYKKDSDNPWIDAAAKFKVGDIVKGIVTRLVPFGAFIEIDKGIDGLVHISQITGKRISKPEEILHIGDEVIAKVIEMNIESRKINLSIREADVKKEDADNLPTGINSGSETQ